MELHERFEASRSRLTSLAFRIVGSHHDAEDAVQTAWLRLQATDRNEVSDLDGWLTTVTARLCLDRLRSRKRRGELPLLSEDVPSAGLAADEAFLRREDVSRALLVLLDELSPRQRVAYVLHDLFGLPFGQIAEVLGTNATAAKKLASRARIKLDDAEPATSARSAEHFEVIEAFLAAARGGDIARLVTLMAPDVVREADLRLLPPGAPAEVRGATAVAKETTVFVDRITNAVPVFVDGHPGAVIAPGGHAYALIRFRIQHGIVTRIDITPYAPGLASLPGARATPRSGK